MPKNHLYVLSHPANSASCPLFSSRVAAGFPSPAEDFVEDSLDLNKHLISHPAATFFIQVKGSSMVDAHIYDEDILIVDRSLEAKDKSIVIATIDGNFTVKRLRIREKKISLEPENQEFHSIELSSESNFEIWGVVTYIIHQAK